MSHTVCYCAWCRWQRATSIWFRLESAARLLTLALTTATRPLVARAVVRTVAVVVARGLARGQARFNPTQDAASTLLGTVLTIKSQYRHLVFAPKSGGEMSQPATGHEAPSPRHPGHCDHSVTGQYADSLSARRPTSQLSSVIIDLPAGANGSCWLMLPVDGPLRRHSRQHTMHPGEARQATSRSPSLFPRQTLTPLLQVWGSPIFATSATAMANLDSQGSVRTYKACATTYSIGQDCIIRSVTHTISGPTLGHAPSDAPRSSRPRPVAVCLSACRINVTEKPKCRCLVLREKAD